MMKKHLTKIFTTLLAMLLVSSFFGAFTIPFADQTAIAQEDLIPEPPTGYTPPPLDPNKIAAAQEKALNIIQNVIMVDFSKYNLLLKEASIDDIKPLTDDTREITSLWYMLIPLENTGDKTSHIT